MSKVVFPSKGLVDSDVVRAQLAAPSELTSSPFGHARARLFRYLARALNWLLDQIDRRGAWKLARCPLCGWSGVAFRCAGYPKGVRWGVICPTCRSAQRHRLAALALQAGDVIGPGTCLHIAPEQCMRGLWTGGPVFGTDLGRAGIDFRADVETLPVRDGSVSFVVCNDVLEHVVDDMRALRELRRVLRPGGVALLHVPVVVTETVAWGYPRADDHDHRRAYGPDVIDTIAAAGLDPGAVLSAELPASTRRKHGLHPNDVVFLSRRAVAAP